MSKLKTILIIGVCVCLLAGCGDTGNQWVEETPTPTSSAVQSEARVSDRPDEITPKVTEVPDGTAAPSAGAEISSVPITVTDVPGTAATPEVTDVPKATVTPKVTVTPKAVTAPADEILEVSRVMYAVTPLNVRASNTTSSAIVGSVETNESVQVTGICDNGWARIDYKGSVAYVYFEYLSNEKTERKNTPTPVPTKTPTPIPAGTATPKPTVSQAGGSGFTPVNGTHGIHSFNDSIHTLGQSLYNRNNDIVQEHLACVNELRTSMGLNALTLDTTVCNIASYRTAEMVSLDYFSHYHPQNSNSACAFDIVYFYQNGYTQIAENIANIDGQWSYYFDRTKTGNKTSLGEQLFNQFAESQGHYENMVNPKYTKIGICVYVSDSYVLITQIFE